MNVPFEIDVREAASGDIVIVKLSGEFDLAGVNMIFDLSGA